jgi:hypothetical protein
MPINEIESNTEKLSSEKRFSIKKEHVSPQEERLGEFGPRVNRKRPKRPRRRPRKKKDKD